MTKSIKSTLSKILKIILPLGFGILLFWGVYHKMDFSKIMDVLRSGVRFDIIALSLAFGLFANIIRAVRWKLLIKPLGANPKTSNLIYAVLGNYAVNLIFPRLGEVWRCGVISKYEKVSFSRLFGTLLIDRLADTISVAIIIMVSFFLNISFFKEFFEKNPEEVNKLQSLLTSPWPYLVIIIIIVAIWVVFKFFGETSLVRKTREFFKNIGAGMMSVWHMKDKWKFLFYTFLIWCGYFLYFYICFFAFDFTNSLGWKEGLIAFGLSSLAVAVPVQGGIGPWHAAVIASLVSFGVGQNDAAAFALIVHTIQQMIFTAVVGIFGVVALPIANKGKKVSLSEIEEEAEAENLSQINVNP